MKKLASELAEQANIILANVDKETKAAHARIRRATLAIQKIGKEYRKASIEADNKKD